MDAKSDANMSDHDLSTKSSVEDLDAVTPAPAFDTTAGYMSEKSAIAFTTGFAHANEPQYFHSRRIKKGEVEKPWLGKKDRAEKWVNILPIIGLIAGVVIAIVIVWDGLQSVTNYNYCSIYEEDFSNGLDMSVWTKEVEVGGYGYVQPHSCE